MQRLRYLIFSKRNFFIASLRTCRGPTISGALKNTMDFGSATEQRAKEFDDSKSIDSGLVSESIMPHVLNMYGSRATAKDFEIYAPNATFEDPLMCAHGVKQIKSAFYSLPKLFSESRIVEYTLKAYATGTGTVEVLIDNKQHYKIFGKDVDLVSLIKLKMEQGKIIRHEDCWDKKPLKNRETVKLPFAGRLAEISRRGSMLITHALMGFGKDPSN
ncbi:hypothetical protein HPP92_005172 [Vanilla planifolia]|uniref:Uncharacterized protein n=1 Tax=Vanilla planifolia TaxID=51239 RepID=A0A835RY93_VANPL|nr:hypothetical protein HPP92_005172 [Vanilla planifolia]